MRRLAPARCSSRKDTKRINNVCHAQLTRTQPINSLQEMHQLARSLGPPHGCQARRPLRIVLDLPLRVDLPAPSDASLDKGALVCRSVQADLVQALQDQLQRSDQVSLVQTSKNYTVHLNHVIHPLQHACKRRLEVRGGVQNSLRYLRRRIQTARCGNRKKKPLALQVPAGIVRNPTKGQDCRKT